MQTSRAKKCPTAFAAGHFYWLSKGNDSLDVASDGSRR